MEQWATNNLFIFFPVHLLVIIIKSSNQQIVINFEIYIYLNLNCNFCKLERGIIFVKKLKFWEQAKFFVNDGVFQKQEITENDFTERSFSEKTNKIDWNEH